MYDLIHRHYDKLHAEWERLLERHDAICDRIRRHVAANGTTKVLKMSDTETAAGRLDARAIFDRIYRRHFAAILPQMIADHARQMAFEDARALMAALQYGTPGTPANGGDSPPLAQRVDCGGGG